MKTLYVHLPFCKKKCFYCSFVVSVGQQAKMDQYLSCIDKEASAYAGEHIDHVYLGGGTPTLLSCEQLERLFEIIRQRFKVSSTAEWTIEANPDGLNPDKVTVLHKNDINRISLGVQSLNDRYLNYLGRTHDTVSAVGALNRLQNMGFDNISVDLMFGFPGQTDDDLARDVAAVAALGSDHLSLYALTIEERSRFFAKSVQLADTQRQGLQYMRVCRQLSDTGYEQYEISNFARGGKMSKHNLHYWTGGEYIGLGVGAHSHLGSRRFWNCDRLVEYIKRIENDQTAEDGHELLSYDDQMRERLLFGLRMNSGVDIKQIQEDLNCSLTDAQQQTISLLEREGFLAKDGNVTKVTDRGRVVLDELCVKLY